MKNIRKVIAILTVFIYFFSSSGIAKAGWLDNWFQQYTSSGIDYYQGQKRGYLTFGSFSARTGLGSSPLSLIHIEPPSFRGGCGGIDIFWGSFGFANAEYIVQKLQKLIQAAPAVAFQLALKVLSASLDDTINRVMSAIDFLNKLQFDECKLLQPLLTVDTSKYKNLPLQERLASVANDVIKGYDKMFHDMFNSKKDKPVSSDELKNATAKCPSELQQLINVHDGSVWSYLASKYGIPSDFEQMARAVTGDFIIEKQNDKPVLQFKAPEIKPDDLRNFKLAKVDKSGSVTQTDVNLVSTVTATLIDAYNQKRNKGTVSSDFIKLARLSPVPLELALNTAVIAKDPSILYGLAPSIAQGIFFNVLMSLITDTIGYLAKLPTMTNIDPETCSIAVNFQADMERMYDNAREALKIINELYQSALKEAHLTFDVALKLYNYNQLIKQTLSRYYAESVINRLMGQR